MYRMSVEGDFCAAHSIRGYNGPCCRLHGHNYKVYLRLEGSELDDLGMLIDFRRVKTVLKSVLDPLDHQYIDELPAFKDIIPTSENIARYIYTCITEALYADSDIKRRVKVSLLEIYEGDKQGVGYCED
jgi:6-pyruvoyltetrahydropterin/6-carboxytetrahydropterin synthase